MPPTLAIDGEVTKNPSATDIATKLEAIDKRDSGISLVTLTLDETHFLSAAGHPAEGFSLSFQDGDPSCEYFSYKFLPVLEIIRVFQDYACGRDWGREKFTWDAMRTLDSKTQLKRLALIVGIVVLLYAAVRVVISRSN